MTIYLYYEGNDLSNLDLEKKDDLLIKYLDNNFSQKLRLKQKKIDKLLGEKIYQSIENQKKENINETKINLQLKNIRQILGVDNFDAYKKIDPTYKKIVSQIKLNVESWDGNLIFVYLPSAKHYNIFYNNKKLKYKKMIEVINDLNIKIIDIHKDVFSLEKNPLENFPANIYGHYNAIGYSKVADHIFKNIKK